MSGLDVIVVTGMSGAGKSAASRCLEDLGFFCIDNLPATLIPKACRSVRPVREAHRARGPRDRRPGGPIPGRPVRDSRWSCGGKGTRCAWSFWTPATRCWSAVSVKAGVRIRWPRAARRWKGSGRKGSPRCAQGQGGSGHRYLRLHGP